MTPSQIIEVPNALRYTVKKSLKLVDKKLVDSVGIYISIDKVRCFLVDSLYFNLDNSGVKSYLVKGRHVHRFDKFKLDKSFSFSLHAKLHLFLAGEVFNKFGLDLVGALPQENDTLDLYFLKPDSESSETFRTYLKKSVAMLKK